jgi:hypothetical protein
VVLSTAGINASSVDTAFPSGGSLEAPLETGLPLELETGAVCARAAEPLFPVAELARV